MGETTAWIISYSQTYLEHVQKFSVSCICIPLASASATLSKNVFHRDICIKLELGIYRGYRNILHPSLPFLCHTFTSRNLQWSKSS